jgi:hypothetical protein
MIDTHTYAPFWFLGKREEGKRKEQEWTQLSPLSLFPSSSDYPARKIATRLCATQWDNTARPETGVSASTRLHTLPASGKVHGQVRSLVRRTGQEARVNGGFLQGCPAPGQFEPPLAKVVIRAALIRWNRVHEQFDEHSVAVGVVQRESRNNIAGENRR